MPVRTLIHRLPIRTAALCLASLGVHPVAEATWSIVLADSATHEVAVGSATCLTDFDLQRLTPVVIPEIGAAAAQSAIDGSASNRLRIYQNLKLGTDPAEIIEILHTNDALWQSRQYGIVDMLDRAATYTGPVCGRWAGGVTGRIGTLTYSIQGNVLTGSPVVEAAEEALRNTEGDIAEKLMAAMEAARFYGGDGRCSCSDANPQGCGSPPPNFTKSAHIGYMIVSRPGDSDGGCSDETGCACGDYFLDFDFAHQSGDDLDPVYQMRAAFTQFRVDHDGLPDAVRSTIEVDHSTLILGTDSQATLAIQLLDWQGAPVTAPISAIRASIADGETGFPAVSVGNVSDLGDGRYSVSVKPTGRIGSDTLWITVDDGIRPVRLTPCPVVSVVMPDGGLTLSEPAPGFANQDSTLCVSHGTPGQVVTFVYNTQRGITNTPCGPILVSNPVIAAQSQVQPDGSACATGHVPTGARGETVQFQAVERGTCRRSNLVTWKFIHE